MLTKFGQLVHQGLRNVPERRPFNLIIGRRMVAETAGSVSAESGSEHYLCAVFTSSTGMRGVAAGATASVDIHIQRYTSDEETQRFAQQLIEGRLQVMKVRHFIPTKSSMACTSMPGSQLERGLSNAAVFIGQ